MNFSRAFLFLENGMILPAWILFWGRGTSTFIAVDAIGVVISLDWGWFVFRGFGFEWVLLTIAANRFSVGSDNSGTVSKLASDVSVSVRGSRVGPCGPDSTDSGVGDRGSAVVGVLHKFSKLNASNGVCSIVGSVTMLLCNGSGSSSELPGERNVLPRGFVMFRGFRGFLASKDGARVLGQLNLCYDFIDKLIT